MKKEKLTPEEKRELRQEIKNWKAFERKMKVKGAWIEETQLTNLQNHNHETEHTTTK